MPDLSPVGVVNCHIPKLPLVPATYFISLVCFSGDKQLDLLPRGCRLQIIGADVFGTGRLPEMRWVNAPVLVEANWEVELESVYVA